MWNIHAEQFQTVRRTVWNLNTAALSKSFSSCRKSGERQRCQLCWPHRRMPMWQRLLCSSVVLAALRNVSWDWQRATAWLCGFRMVPWWAHAHIYSRDLLPLWAHAPVEAFIYAGRFCKYVPIKLNECHIGSKGTIAANLHFCLRIFRAWPDWFHIDTVRFGSSVQLISIFAADHILQVLFRLSCKMSGDMFGFEVGNE